MTKGYLHVMTSPIKGDIFVNGEYRGTGSINIELEQGTHSVSFGQIDNYITPLPINVAVNPSFVALVTIEYTKK